MKHIGRYAIRGLLGRGGMGKVYRVELPDIGKIAALKLLDPDPLIAKLMGAAKLHRMFLSEARTMAGLNHPNIVAIQDFDNWHGKPFYVMDFFANNLGVMIGESSRTEAPSRRLPVEKTIDYARQTLNGLIALHDAGICHRDIKPFNLLVTSWDFVKICDFGLSKLRGETFAGPANLNVGSPFYAAPEQEQNPDAADQRADLYAVGVIFYRMLAGRLPDLQASGSGYQPLAHIHEDLDAGWDRFIARATAIRPEDRFPDAETMSEALAELETTWQERKERICALPTQPTESRSGSCRQAPATRPSVKLPPEAAQSLFGLDALWRPQCYAQPDFDPAPGPVITDRATGLQWQRAGSKRCLTWRQADDYIARLNQEAYGGLRSWRLPTVNELVSILLPPARVRDLCLPPLFDPTQRWLWSADRRAYTAAYYVDLTLGFVGWQDISAPFYVRAVSGRSRCG